MSPIKTIFFKSSCYYITIKNEGPSEVAHENEVSPRAIVVIELNDVNEISAFYIVSSISSFSKS